MEKEKVEKQRSNLQSRSLHKGCQDIADILIENNITLNAIIKNLEIRPTKESIKEVYKAIAYAKFGVDSTTKLKTNQIDPVWEDLIKAVSETTGVFIPFPSQENTESYLNSFDENQ